MVKTLKQPLSEKTQVEAINLPTELFIREPSVKTPVLVK